MCLVDTLLQIMFTPNGGVVIPETPMPARVTELKKTSSSPTDAIIPTRPTSTNNVWGLPLPLAPTRDPLGSPTALSQMYGYKNTTPGITTPRVSTYDPAAYGGPVGVIAPIPQAGLGSGDRHILKKPMPRTPQLTITGGSPSYSGAVTGSSSSSHDSQAVPPTPAGPAPIPCGLSMYHGDPIEED